PVSIMTSQKVWMDTTLSFLMLMGVLFFVIGLKFDKSSFFIWSGLACGLATLTKYTGIFATVNIGLFAFAYRRELFRNRSFIIGLILPFALLLPWFYANYLVYGGGFLFKQKSLHLNEHLYLVFFILFLSLGILKGLSIYLRRFFVMEDDQQKLEKGVLTRKRIDMVLGITLAIVVFKHIILSLNFNHLPRTSWAGAVLRDSLFTFYVTQLLEYSFVYFFAFASFFIERKERLVEISLLRYGALIVLIFFSIWKYFQCRYILFAIPLLVILAFELIFMIYEKIEKIDGFLPRLFLKSALLFPIIYGLGRTVMIDLLLSFPNDMCYF
ncbi:MAG: glycosyltransferase family 39 protein, partial [Candidatus Omnitrophica bacterium]|nr:glycosyltransferase family 39 protein [Candidatus Omnitrophota bacterium]